MGVMGAGAFVAHLLDELEDQQILRAELIRGDENTREALTQLATLDLPEAEHTQLQIALGAQMEENTARFESFITRQRLLEAASNPPRQVQQPRCEIYRDWRLCWHAEKYSVAPHMLRRVMTHLTPVQQQRALCLFDTPLVGAPAVDALSEYVREGTSTHAMIIAASTSWGDRQIMQANRAASDAAPSRRGRCARRGPGRA